MIQFFLEKWNLLKECGQVWYNLKSFHKEMIVLYKEGVEENNEFFIKIFTDIILMEYRNEQSFTVSINKTFYYVWSSTVTLAID